MKSRQDAWTEENDLMLAETVLRHVREGSTQLNAFEEVGDRLDRTSAACGFRWNAVVRHDYEKALALAKKQRKQRQRILGKDHTGKKKLLYDPPVVPMFMEEFSSPLVEEILDMEYEDEDEVTMVEVQEENRPTTFTTAISSNKLESTPKQSSYQPITLDQVIGYLHSIKTSQMQNDVYRLENDRLKREMSDLQRKNRELENKLKNVEKNSVVMQEDYETLMKIMNRARKLTVLEEEDERPTKFKMDKNGNLEKVAE